MTEREIGKEEVVPSIDSSKMNADKDSVRKEISVLQSGGKSPEWILCNDGSMRYVGAAVSDDPKSIQSRMLTVMGSEYGGGLRAIMYVKTDGSREVQQVVQNGETNNQATAAPTYTLTTEGIFGFSVTDRSSSVGSLLNPNANKNPEGAMVSSIGQFPSWVAFYGNTDVLNEMGKIRQRGVIITELNGQKVTSAADFSKILKNSIFGKKGEQTKIKFHYAPDANVNPIDGLDSKIEREVVIKW